MNIRIALATATAVMAFSGSASAVVVTGTAAANANIVAPASVTSIRTLDFGTIARPTTGSNTIDRTSVV